MYTGPEFLLGQVYDGNFDSNFVSGDVPGNDHVVLYRPVYVCVPSAKLSSIQTPKNRQILKLEQTNSKNAKKNGSNHSPKNALAPTASGTSSINACLGAAGTAASSGVGTPQSKIKGDKTHTSTM